MLGLPFSLRRRFFPADWRRAVAYSTAQQRSRLKEDALSVIFSSFGVGGTWCRSIDVGEYPEPIILGSDAGVAGCVCATGDYSAVLAAILLC